MSKSMRSIRFGTTFLSLLDLLGLRFKSRTSLHPIRTWGRQIPLAPTFHGKTLSVVPPLPPETLRASLAASMQSRFQIGRPFRM